MELFVSLEDTLDGQKLEPQGGVQQLIPVFVERILTTPLVARKSLHSLGAARDSVGLAMHFT